MLIDPRYRSFRVWLIRHCSINLKRNAIDVTRFGDETYCYVLGDLTASATIPIPTWFATWVLRGAGRLP